MGRVLGKRLAEARRRAGITQVDLAVAMDRDRTLISHMEAGRAGKLAEGLGIVARELNVSVDWLLGLTEDPTPASDRAALPFDVDSLPLFAQSAMTRITAAAGQRVQYIGEDMSLRDWWAGWALAGIAASGRTLDPCACADTAQLAYKLANAMLRAREPRGVQR